MKDDAHKATDTWSRLSNAKALVVKIGSALLVDEAGSLRASWLRDLCADIGALRAGGAQIVVVSSGAVGLGLGELRRAGVETPPKLRMEEKQAAAAIGQGLLHAAWREALAPTVAAQVLLTLPDTENRRRYLNARATLTTLIDKGVTPVVNENDTTGTDELRYGDNDRLAAHVAQMIGADALLMLSDIDGLYTADPRATEEAVHIGRVATIDARIEAMAGGPNAARGAGSGGMRTKIEAAKIATAAGCAAIVAKGDIAKPIDALRAGARATLFEPADTPENARRAWIGGGLRPHGALVIDDGAARAVQSGASLLAAGVVSCEGDFDKGDAVEIRRASGLLVGRGLCAYDARDAARVAGLKSDEVEAALGYRRAAVVHRDDLVLIRAPEVGASPTTQMMETEE